MENDNKLKAVTFIPITQLAKPIVNLNTIQAILYNGSSIVWKSIDISLNTSGLLPLNRLQGFVNNNTFVLRGDGFWTTISNNNINANAAISISKMAGYPADQTKCLLGNGTWNKIDINNNTSNLLSITRIQGFPVDSRKYLRGDGIWAQVTLNNTAGQINANQILNYPNDITKVLRGDGTWGSPVTNSSIFSNNIIVNSHINMNSYTIQNVATPLNNSDVATKQYVDNQVTAHGGTTQILFPIITTNATPTLVYTTSVLNFQSIIIKFSIHSISGNDTGFYNGTVKIKNISNVITESSIILYTTILDSSLTNTFISVNDNMIFVNGLNGTVKWGGFINESKI